MRQRCLLFSVLFLFGLIGCEENETRPQTSSVEPPPASPPVTPPTPPAVTETTPPPAPVSSTEPYAFEREHSTPVAPIFDASVEEKTRDLLKQDLKLLAKMHIEEIEKNKEKNRKTLGVKEISGPILNDWLGKRMKVLVGDRYNYRTSLTISTAAGFSPRLFSSLPVWTPFHRGEFSNYLMANVGAGLYRAGKMNKWIYSIFAGGTDIVIDTPRVGIQKIGPLFMNDKIAYSKDAGARGNVMWRLSTYFHESRHDDGNGTNAGFPHRRCTHFSLLDHMGIGVVACDEYYTGPYAVETVVLAHFRKACDKCSSAERTGLELALAALAKRVNAGATFKDIRAEKIS